MRVSERVLLEPEGGVLIRSRMPGGAISNVVDTESKEPGLLPRCDRPPCEQKGERKTVFSHVFIIPQALFCRRLTSVASTKRSDDKAEEPSLVPGAGRQPFKVLITANLASLAKLVVWAFKVPTPSTDTLSSSKAHYEWC